MRDLRSTPARKAFKMQTFKEAWRPASISVETMILPRIWREHRFSKHWGKIMFLMLSQKQKGGEEE